MAGLLSGLSGLGLDNLEGVDIFAEETKEKSAEKTAPKAVAVQPDESSFIFDKTMQCPVCGKNFVNKVMKTGKNKLLGTDLDLRPRYEGIDAVKYDVFLCNHCGYASLSRFYGNIISSQGKLIQESISKKVTLKPHQGEIYTYEDAIERYKLTLANAVVKKAKASEKAYICLKSAWLMRGYAESLEAQGKQDKIEELRTAENEYLCNAFNGFAEARKSEGFPMCGMDEHTVDYLLAVLAIRMKRYEVAGKLISGILASSANARTKDKARDLKDLILEETRKSVD